MESEQIPQKCQENIKFQSSKKGSKKDPANYPQITLLSSVLKLFTKILAEDISSHGIDEEQQSCRKKNRSIVEANSHILFMHF